MENESREASPQKKDFVRSFLILFTAAYLLLFGAWFYFQGNTEYLWYVALIYLFGAWGWNHVRDEHIPNTVLFALSFAGFLHMAGRSIYVGEDILYNVVLGGIQVGPEIQAVIFRYDQLLHAYGYGVGAILVNLLIRSRAPELSRTARMSASILIAMGVGAGNEIAEFLASLNLSHTYVGDYYNTGLDLVANTLGAVIAVCGFEWYRSLKSDQ